MIQNRKRTSGVQCDPPVQNPTEVEITKENIPLRKAISYLKKYISVINTIIYQTTYGEVI